MNEYLRIALTNLKYSEKRTWLTIVGIFIGIAAVVALISIGQGLQDSIQDQFSKIGTDKLFISSSQDAFGGTAGADLTKPITEDDMDTIRRVRGVQDVTGYSVRSTKVEVGEDIGFYFAASIPTSQDEYALLRELLTVDVADGRELRPGDKSAVLIGADYTRSDVFLEPLSVGDRITVNGKKFTVAGILEPFGNSNDDRMIWMPKESFDELFNISKEVSQIIVRTAPGENPPDVADRIEKALLDDRGLDEKEKDFSISTPEELLASFNTVLLIVRVVLIGIAGISLLVGGIGISNTMFTAVLERTKEIGIMKAIGATPHAIRLIFLAEAGFLGFGGGAVGVIVGLGIAKLVEGIGQAAMRTDFLTAYVSWELIVGALAFSTIIGMVSGYIPARQASKQNVVDSLRYE